VDYLLTVRCSAALQFHPFRVAELIERLITVGQSEAERTLAETDMVDHNAEDALQLQRIRIRSVFLRPRLVLRHAIDMYFASNKWLDDGVTSRVFDELERAFGLRHLSETPINQPPPRLVDVSFTAIDLQRHFTLSDQEADAFLLSNEPRIRDAMLKAGYEMIEQLGTEAQLQRR
jgi:hypothetical protein